MATRKPDPTALAARRKEVTEQIAALIKEKAALDEKLHDLDPAQTYQGNGVTLSFVPVRTVDYDFMAKEFPADKRPDLYKLTLDTAEVKKQFSPLELQGWQTINYRIKIVED